MKRPDFLSKGAASLSKVPRKAWIIGGALLSVVTIYSLVFFIQKPVEYSYSQEECIGHFLIAPNLHKTSSSDFTVTPKDVTGIGPAALFSTKLCFEPSTSPKEGAQTVAFAPFGGPIAAKQFKLTVPKAPAARTADFIDKTIATVRPLQITLSQPDNLHKYSLKVADKTASCPQEDAKIVCDVASLDLEQGAEYTVALQKTFKNAAPITVASGDLATHVPLQNTENSIPEGHVAYDMPKTFAFAFDKELDTAKATLQKVVGETTEDIEVTTTVEAATAQIAIAEDLPRESSYRLTLTEALSVDGSSIDDPIVLNLTTSGGPKVSGVSIGAANAAVNAQIVVTFDQPLHESVDVTKVVRTTGAPSAVRKLSATQVALTLQNAPNCAAFAVVVDKGLKSGSNNETSQQGWSHQSRTVCGTSWVIGYSVRGRPIVAHSFGSGSTTLYTGGIHGNEGSTVITMNAWVQYLQANAGTVLPEGKRVVVVPNTNPDGIATGARNNARNVNLGRNFGTANWKADIETANGMLINGGGTSPASEPEAAALAALTRQLRPRLEVSFHSQGRLVGANKYGDSVAIGDMYAKTVGYRTMFYNAEAVMGYPMTGEYEDWMGESLGIPAILIELPGHSGNYFNSQLPALKKLLNV